MRPGAEAARRPRLRGLDDSSSSGGRGSASPAMRRSRRLARARAEEMADAEEARAFQPEEVDEARCQALMWNHGYGKLQCGRKPLRGRDLCGVHQQAPHGKVRGPIPEKKLDEFRKRLLRPAKESKQWYARHLMWAYASEMVPDLEHLSEVDDAGQYKLTDELNERCLKKMQENVEKHKSREAKKYERGACVRTRDDRVDRDTYGNEGSQYGTERERYNGRGGGRVFKWYSRAVFNNYLARMGASEQSCTT